MTFNAVKKTWRERIAEARQRGGFDRDDMDAASCWLTCAVGEQRATLPHVVTYIPARYLSRSRLRPADPELRKLGSARWGFYGAVRRQDFDGAEKILDAIEDRALVLKRETLGV